MKNPDDIIVFLDNAGRKILATLVSSEGTTLVVKNPAVLFEVEAENGQLKSNMIPIYFPDYSDAENYVSPTWEYYRPALAISWDAVISERFVKIYNNLFKSPTPAPKTEEENVVKMFDE